MKLRKIMSAVLALVLLLSLATPAFAGSETGYKTYSHYLNIGDSIARGCGLEFMTNQNEPTYRNDDWNNYDKNENGIAGGHNYPGSYPQIVAGGINPARTEADSNFQFSGMRAADCCYALGMDIEEDEYIQTEYAEHPEYGRERLLWHNDLFIKHIKQADLITLQLGMNDVFYSAMVNSGMNDPDQLKQGMDVIIKTLEDYVLWMSKGFEKMQVYYPLLLDELCRIRKDAGGDPADIVLVGVYNAGANCPIADEIPLPIGELQSFMADSVNAYLRGLAESHENMYFADISMVETPTTSGTMTFLDALEYVDIGGERIQNKQRATTINSHPTAEGYKYIARQILNVLPPEEVKCPDTFIRFNLPTAEKVTGVKLGTRDAAFTQNGYELTVANYSPFAKSMTVTGTNGGKTVIYVYDLNYTPGEGYTAHRITGTNDLTGSLSRILSGFVSILRVIIHAIGDLFKQ